MKEVEKVKKKGKGAIIFIIILLLIIMCLVGFILIDKKIVKVPFDLPFTSNSTEPKEDNVIAEQVVDLSVNDANVVELFNNAHYRVNSAGTIDQFVFNNSKLTLEDMDEKYKFGLAANIFLEKASLSNPSITGYSSEIREEDVKLAYERVFGPDTYRRVEKIDLNCPVYTLDYNTNTYKANSGCGGTTAFTVYEKIISAKKFSSRIEITSAAVFHQLGGLLYKDYNQKELLKELTNEEQANAFTFYDNVIIPFINENKDNLQQYTYTFTLNEDGFYYYTGVEKTKN